MEKELPKIYAVSDIHGDYDRLAELLLSKNIINNNHDWISNNNKLIVGGDLTDRHNQGIQVIELLMKLEKQALMTDGRVITLLGNHDCSLIARVYEFINNYFSAWECRQVFIENGGIDAEALHVSKNSEIFNWLKNRPLIHKEGKYLFQHADSCRFYRDLGTIDEINNKAKILLETGEGAWQLFYHLTNARYFDPYMHYNKKSQQEYIERYLNNFDCELIVHGHSRLEQGSLPQYSFNNCVLNIDCSMSAGYGNDLNRGCIVEF